MTSVTAEKEGQTFKPEFALPKQFIPELMIAVFHQLAIYDAGGQQVPSNKDLTEAIARCLVILRPDWRNVFKKDGITLLQDKVEWSRTYCKNAGLLKRAEGRNQFVLDELGRVVMDQIKADSKAGNELLRNICNCWEEFRMHYNCGVTERILDRLGHKTYDEPMQENQTYDAAVEATQEAPVSECVDGPEIVTDEPEYYSDGPEIITLEDVDDDVPDHDDAGTHAARFAANVSSALPWQMKLDAGAGEIEEASGNGYDASGAGASNSFTDIVPEGFEAAVSGLEAELADAGAAWEYFLRVDVADLGIRQVFCRSSDIAAVPAQTYNAMRDEGADVAADADGPEIVTHDDANDEVSEPDAKLEIRLAPKDECDLQNSFVILNGCDRWEQIKRAVLKHRDAANVVVLEKCPTTQQLSDIIKANQFNKDHVILVRDAETLIKSHASRDAIKVIGDQAYLNDAEPFFVHDSKNWTGCSSVNYPGSVILVLRGDFPMPKPNGTRYNSFISTYGVLRSIDMKLLDEDGNMRTRNAKLQGPGSGPVIIERLLRGESQADLIAAGARPGTANKHEGMIRYIRERGISDATTDVELIGMFKSDPRKTSNDAEGYMKRICHVRQVLKTMNRLGMAPAASNAISDTPTREKFVEMLRAGKSADDITAHYGIDFTDFATIMQARA